ncbi:MAG: outer membrane beta-barrel protein [Bacteroidales bacterium]|nr:outer membrane beta-barrel protein [Bacteroidales bacterium]
MRKTFLTLVGILLCYTMFAQQEDLKKHNFGLSLNFGSYPMGKDYFEAIHDDAIRLKSAVAFDVALKYEYMLNTKNTFSLTAEPGYANHLLTIVNPIASINNPISNIDNRHSIHTLTLPILVNYRLPIAQNVNLLTATGANASFYLTKRKELVPTSFLTFEEPFTVDFVLRAGIEVKAKQRFQLNVSYFLPLSGNTGFEYQSPNAFVITGYGGVNRLMFGVSLFFQEGNLIK